MGGIMKSKYFSNTDEVAAMQYFYKQRSREQRLVDLINCTRKFCNNSSLTKDYVYKNTTLEDLSNDPEGVGRIMQWMINSMRPLEDRLLSKRELNKRKQLQLDF